MRLGGERGGLGVVWTSGRFGDYRSVVEECGDEIGLFMQCLCNATAGAIGKGRRGARRLCAQVETFVVFVCGGSEDLDGVRYRCDWHLMRKKF